MSLIANVVFYPIQDVIFHNEAYTNSGGSSADASPEYEYAAADAASAAAADGTNAVHQPTAKLMSDGSLSPQRNQSFIVAVINAIKSATKHTTGKKDVIDTTKAASAAAVGADEDESDSTEMLDSETEPCLMMENVLEDVSMPDSHSHNMVSSTGLILASVAATNPVYHQPQHPASSTMATSFDASVEMATAPVVNSSVDMDRDEESIHNLSLAIFNRQQIEHQTNIIMR